MRNLFKSILSALIILVVFQSCGLKKELRHQKKCEKWDVCQQHDSLIIKDTVKIDTILVDDSEMWLDMLFECDSSGDILIRKLSNLETENADLKMKLINNRLVVYVKSPTDTITVIKPIHSEIQVKTITKKVNELNSWQRIRIFLGNVMLFSILLIVLYIVLRLIFKIK